MTPSEFFKRNKGERAFLLACTYRAMEREAEQGDHPLTIVELAKAFKRGG